MENNLRKSRSIPDYIRCGNCELNDTDECPMSYRSYYDDDGLTEVDLVTNNKNDDFCSRFVMEHYNEL